MFTRDEFFYPSLTQLISAEDIPGDIVFIEDLANDIVKKFFYKDYFYGSSPTGDLRQYSLTLLYVEPIAFVPFGDGGPKISINTTTPDGFSEFPVRLELENPIKRFLSNRNIADILTDPLELLKLFQEILGINIEDLFNQVLEVFLDEENIYSDFKQLFDDVIGEDANFPNTLEEIFPFIEDNYNALEVIFNLFINPPQISTEEILPNLKSALRIWLGDVNLEDTLKNLLPQFLFSVDTLNVRIDLPAKSLLEIDENGEVKKDPNGDSIPAHINVNIGSIQLSSQDGFTFNNVGEVSLPKSMIGNTGFIISFSEMKLDLSRTTNIPEADADGRPVDFMGVYAQNASIELPKDWFTDETDTTAELFANNFLIGTGGVSGTIGLQAIGTATDPTLWVNLGENGFRVGFKDFSLTFQQNQVTDSNITGALEIPGFEDVDGNTATIEISVDYSADGSFSITASEDQGIQALYIKDILSFTLNSLTIGREGDGETGRWYLALSGDLNFLAQEGTLIGDNLPKGITVEELKVYEDGEFSFTGGSIQLAKPRTLKIGPAEISITGIHVGSHEQFHLGRVRKYKYFGFDGGLSVSPGGVDARGDGIKFYFLTDNKDLTGLEKLDFFIRISSISLDLIIPGNVPAEDAAVIIKGYLSMKQPDPENEDPDAGTEYIGGVSVGLPKLGMAASAAMRYNPALPSFLVDIELEIPTPIPLGPSGLGIYGFRGLIGQRYVASKQEVGLSESDSWYDYYKKKVAPDYREGIQVSKFAPQEGFSIGAGISLATGPDAGFSWSAKLFLLLSLPDVILLQGQAQLTKERIGLDSTTDPPFSAMISLTKESIEAAFGVDYKVDKKGKIARVNGVAEMGFFFRDASAWYINIGRDEPKEKRILAKIFDLWQAYFYLMLNAQGVRTGAGMSFELEESVGPLSAKLNAYWDVAGYINARPVQLGAAIQIGGSVALKVLGVGVNVSARAALTAEAPKPFIITGTLDACAKILGEDRCISFEFVWEYDLFPDKTPLPAIGATNLPGAAMAVNVNTKENFPLLARQFTGAQTLDAQFAAEIETAAAANGDYLIPLDSFIDVALDEPVKPLSGNGALVGGVTAGARYTRLVPPEKMKSRQVMHEFIMESLSIKYFANGTWHDYDIYEALTHADERTNLPANRKSGYWQIDKPNEYTKFRLLAQTPYSYTVDTGQQIDLEDLGLDAQYFSCPDDPIMPTCIPFADLRRTGPGSLDPSEYIPGNTRLMAKNTLFVFSGDTDLVNEPCGNHDNMIPLASGESVDIFLPKDCGYFALNLAHNLEVMEVTFYATNEMEATTTPTGRPQYHWQEIETVTIAPGTYCDAASTWEYSNTDQAFARVKITCGIQEDAFLARIETGDGQQNEAGTIIPTSNVIPARWASASGYTQESMELLALMNQLATNGFLQTEQVAHVLDAGTYDGIWFNTALFPYATTEASTVTVYFFGALLQLRFDAPSVGYQEYITFSTVGTTLADYANLQTFSNLRVASDNIVPGDNYAGLMEVTYDDNGNTVTKTLHFSSPNYSLINLQPDSELIKARLYQACFLPVAEEKYNLTIPNVDELQQEINAMLYTLKKKVQPIWRPYTTYAVELKVKDRVSLGNQLEPEVTQHYAFGFRTGGPLGHFHRTQTGWDTNTPPTPIYDYLPTYEALKATDQEDRYKLAGLKHYLDYAKSYPNANGKLVNAKPLYWEAPNLVLFFNKDYLYAMYSQTTTEVSEGVFETFTFPTYGSGAAALPTTTNRLDIQIRDPEGRLITGQDEQGNPTDSFPNNFNPNVSVQSTRTRIKDDELDILKNLLENGNPCVDKPEDYDKDHTDPASFTIPNLNPQKLYSAMVNAVISEGSEEKLGEVHTYNFETSRFANFAAHVNSYILDTDENGATTKAAFFDYRVAFSTDQITNAQAVLGNTLAETNNLVTQYADLYERLMQGALEIPALEDAETTEFNRLIDDNTGKVLGIWVRSPEPFNDPKIPPTVLADTIQLAVGGGNTADQTAFFSKDRAQAFITPSNWNLDLADGDLAFTFKYKQFDGIGYVDDAAPITFTLTPAQP